MSEAPSPMPQEMPQLEARVIEYQRNGNVIHQQRFYETDTEGRKHQVTNEAAREQLAPYVEQLFGYMAGGDDIPSDEIPQENPWADLRDAQERVAAEERRLKGDAARWTSRVKIYAAGQDVIDQMQASPDYVPTAEEVTALNNYDHQQDLDAKAHQEAITEDDIAYYRHLQEQQAEKSKSEAAPAETEEAMAEEVVIENEPEVISPELGKEAVEQLSAARLRLAGLAAEMRRRTFPRKGLREEYEQALDDYDKVYESAGVQAVVLLREAGVDEGDIRALVVQGVIGEKLEFDRSQLEYIDQTSEKGWNQHLKKFAAFWGRSGIVKRAIVGGTIGAGMTVVTAGAAGVVGLGGLVAGAAALSTRVARGMMISKLNKEAKYPTEHQKMSAEDLHALHETAQTTATEADQATLEQSATRLIGDAVDYRVRLDQKENKKRLGVSVAATLGGAALGSLIDNVVDFPGEKNTSAKPEGSGDSSGSSTSSIPSERAPTDTLPDPTGTPPSTAEAVTLHVAPGEGFEDTLQHQYGLSDAQSREAFVAMRPFLDGQPGTYSEAGDIRILAPGNFALNPQATEALRQYLESIGESEQ